MNPIFLIFAGIFFIVQAAFAVKKASGDDIEAIRTQMAKAVLIDQEIIEAKRILEQGKNADLSGYKIKELERSVRRAKDKKSAERTKAIHMTLAAYDLWPDVRRGISVAPMAKGRTIQWIPVALEPESRQVQNRHGVPRDVKQLTKPHTGITFQDGVSYLPDKAFLGGPGYLATILLHERIHFEQNITPGKGDIQSSAEANVEAYQAEFDNIKFLLDPKMKGYDAIAADIKAKLNECKATVEQVKKSGSTLIGRLKQLVGPSGPPDILPRSLHSREELEAIRAESDALEEIVAKELFQARREREREASRRAERLRAESLENVRAAAAFTCRVGMIYGEKLDFPRVSDQGFYCLNDPGWSSEDDCEARIFSMLLGQLCRSGALDPGPINEMRNRVYGSRAGTAPLVPEKTRTSPPPVVEASSLPLKRSALERLVARACAAPRSPDLVRMEEYFWFPDRELGDLREAAKKLPGCAGELLAEVGRLNMSAPPGSGIDMDWLRAAAVRNSSPESPDRPNSAPPEDGQPERDRGGNRVGDGNGPARDQAGKIGRGGRWPR